MTQTVEDAKKSTNGKTGLPSVAFSVIIWSYSPPSPRLWRSSFARSVALRLFLLAQKKIYERQDRLAIRSLSVII